MHESVSTFPCLLMGTNIESIPDEFVLSIMYAFRVLISNNIHRSLYCNGPEIKYIMLSVSNGVLLLSVSDWTNAAPVPHGVFHAVR